MENTLEVSVLLTPIISIAFISPLLSQPGVKEYSVPVSIARPCLFGQPLQFQGNVFNFSSSCAAVGIDPHPGGLTYRAEVTSTAPVKPPETALCSQQEYPRVHAI